MSKHQEWAHSVDMYVKWAELASRGSEYAKRMMQVHREKFPTMGKVFDQIDEEAGK